MSFDHLKAQFAAWTLSLSLTAANFSGVTQSSFLTAEKRSGLNFRTTSITLMDSLNREYGTTWPTGESPSEPMDCALRLQLVGALADDPLVATHQTFFYDRYRTVIQLHLQTGALLIGLKSDSDSAEICLFAGLPVGRAFGEFEDTHQLFELMTDTVEIDMPPLIFPKLAAGYRLYPNKVQDDHPDWGKLEAIRFFESEEGTKFTIFNRVSPKEIHAIKFDVLTGQFGILNFPEQRVLHFQARNSLHLVNQQLADSGLDPVRNFLEAFLVQTLGPALQAGLRPSPRDTLDRANDL